MDSAAAHLSSPSPNESHGLHAVVTRRAGLPRRSVVEYSTPTSVGFSPPRLPFGPMPSGSPLSPPSTKHSSFGPFGPRSGSYSLQA